MRRCTATLMTVLASCVWPTGGDYDLTLLTAANTEDHLGVIEFYGEPVRVDAPLTSAAGQSFDIVVTTYGAGCTRVSRTDVVVSDRNVQIRPMNRIVGTAGEPAVGCSLVLLTYEHTATLSFDTAGPVHVEVLGRQLPGDKPTSHVFNMTITAATAVP